MLPMLMLAAKAGALAKTAGPVLAEWNRLDPEAKARVQSQASAVTRDLNQLRRALGVRLFKKDEEISWEDARALALDPALDFVMAKQLVDILLRDSEIAEADLREELGAVGEYDAVFVAALEIAEDDGYIEQSGPSRWRITGFADRQLENSEHVRFIEQAIVNYVNEIGLAGRDELALAVGAPEFHSDEFLAAVERALVGGSLEWLGPGLYGLPVAQLVDLEPPEQEVDAAPKADQAELKLVLGDLKGSISNLKSAVSGARAHRPASLDAGAAALSMESPPAQEAPTSTNDSLEVLRALKDLYDAGILTDEEFQSKKTELLGRM